MKTHTSRSIALHTSPFGFLCPETYTEKGIRLVLVLSKHLGSASDTPVGALPAAAFPNSRLTPARTPERSPEEPR